MNPNSVLFLLTGDVKALFKHRTVHSRAHSRPSASRVIVSVVVLAKRGTFICGSLLGAN